MNSNHFKDKAKTPARIEYVRVENYRVLRQVEFPMKPLTLLLGPNGSGKSTFFDVFSFLSDCFRYGLQYAWDKRGRAEGIRARGSAGPIIIEIKYREQPAFPPITYHLAVDEEKKGPVVVEEWLQWQQEQRGKPFRFLEYRHGEVRIISGEPPDRKSQEAKTSLRSPDLIAANTMGQFANYPRVAALREFILGWRLFSSLPVDTCGQLMEDSHGSATFSGDSLPNTIQSPKRTCPDLLQRTGATTHQPAQHSTSMERKNTPDVGAFSQVKDSPLDHSAPFRHTSDDNIKIRAYLTILCDHNRPPFIGIEEPEKSLGPHLLSKLAEEFRTAAQFAQILISTHSPTFVNFFHPEEVLVLSRDQQGYTQTTLAANIRGVQEFINAGARLGDLWLEGYLTGF